MKNRFLVGLAGSGSNFEGVESKDLWITPKML
jgi:hypothetical protein